jgi:hypothetical protein
LFSESCCDATPFTKEKFSNTHKNAISLLFIVHHAIYHKLVDLALITSETGIIATASFPVRHLRKGM